MSEAVRLADKVAARDYVREAAGEPYLVQALAIVDRAEDIAFDALPERFIVKSNRTSGRNFVVRDRSRMDVSGIRRLVDSLLKMEYGRRQGEHWYADIAPKILIERWLQDADTPIPFDYQFHVFHGKVEFIRVNSEKVFSDDFWGNFPTFGQTYVDNRQAVHACYDRDWQLAPFRFAVGVPPRTPLKRPAAADEMIAVAEKLAGDWGYVRVDLYCLNDREVYFGELTFAHAGGHFRLVPAAYSEYFGGLWDIHRRYVRPDRRPLPLLSD
jgi:hypothetical protein